MNFAKANHMGYNNDRWEPHWFKQAGRYYPEAKHGSFKGAILRGFIYYLYDVCKHHCSDAHGMLRLAVLAGFVAFDIICRKNGRFLSRQAQREIALAVQTSCVAYNSLALESWILGKTLYKLVPKMHMYTHMGYDMAMHANPRRVTTYQDEDFVGKIKKVIRASQISNPMHCKYIGTQF